MQQSASPTRSFRFGLFEADVSNKTLTRNGVRVKIQDQPFRVLLLLLEHPGEIVPRDQLRSNLWPDGTFVDFDGSLNVILKKLRAVLDDNPENPRFIETVPRSGYRFIAPVTVIRAQPVPPVEIASPIDRPVRASAGDIPYSEVPHAVQPAIARNQNVRAVILYTAASLAIVAGGFFAFTRWARPRQTASASSSSPVSAVHLRRSVAVLGFQNLQRHQRKGGLEPRSLKC